MRPVGRVAAASEILEQVVVALCHRQRRPLARRTQRAGSLALHGRDEVHVGLCGEDAVGDSAGVVDGDGRLRLRTALAGTAQRRLAGARPKRLTPGTLLRRRHRDHRRHVRRVLKLLLRVPVDAARGRPLAAEARQDARALRRLRDERPRGAQLLERGRHRLERRHLAARQLLLHAHRLVQVGDLLHQLLSLPQRVLDALHGGPVRALRARRPARVLQDAHRQEAGRRVGQLAAERVLAVEQDGVEVEVEGAEGVVGAEPVPVEHPQRQRAAQLLQRPEVEALAPLGVQRVLLHLGLVRLVANRRNHVRVRRAAEARDAHVRRAQVLGPHAEHRKHVARRHLVLGLLHRHHDGADEQVEQHEAREDLERHKVQRRQQQALALALDGRALGCVVADRVRVVGRLQIVAPKGGRVQVVRPVVARGGLPQRHECPVQVAKVDRIRLGEHDHAKHGVQVELQPHQQRDVADGRQGVEQRHDKHLQLRQRLDELEHAQQAQQPQDGHVRAADRQEGRHDDEEIEAVPPVREVHPRARSLADQLHHQLEHERPLHERLEKVHHDGQHQVGQRVRLHAHHDGRQHDEAHDGALELPRLRDRLHAPHLLAVPRAAVLAHGRPHQPLLVRDEALLPHFGARLVLLARLRQAPLRLCGLVVVRLRRTDVLGRAAARHARRRGAAVALADAARAAVGQHRRLARGDDQLRDGVRQP
mmetsp:Transcript_7495/g.26749  ORF Transcript_7495/g.26749 Transcript_7495/m.26749 type:complete len:705 (+) Transcript_7495:1743-3857(+)